MALVALGVDETLGFFATAQCAWIAWLQSCKVDTDKATQESMAAFKAARDAHAPAILEWACLFLREHCFRGDILELLNGLRDLKHRQCVAKVTLFSFKANVFGWVDLVHAVLNRLAPGVIDAAVAKEDMMAYARSHRLPLDVRHTGAITRRFGLPAETSMVVFDSKPETISISCRTTTVFQRVAPCFGPDDDHGDSLSKDFLHGLHGLQACTRMVPTAIDRRLHVYKHELFVRYAAEVVRCVSPPPSDEVVSAADAMLAVLHYMRN